MAGPPVFVVAEFDGKGTVIGELTRTIAGARVDTMAETGVQLEGRLMVPTAFLFRGFPDEAMQGLLERFRRVARNLEILSSDKVRQRVLLRALVPPDATPSPAIHVITEFLGPLRNPWVHVDEGQFYLRARILNPSQGEQLAKDMRAALKAAGVEAQVEVQPVDRNDLSVWDELVQATLGLNT